MATKTKNDRTAPVKEWVGCGDEKKLRDMMGLSDDTPAASDETNERTAPDEASAHTPPEDGGEMVGVTTAVPTPTDAPEATTLPNECGRAASSAPDRGDEISGRTTIPIDGDGANEQSGHTLRTLPSEQSAPSTSTHDSGIITNTQSTADTDPIRRTTKQRKSDLNEYRATFMNIPKIKDRKPVFVSGEVRDRLDRIVRLLGERGMSVSGLIENIALHHIAVHEADIEHWRKM
jgi:hypothetical protein